MHFPCAQITPGCDAVISGDTGVGLLRELTAHCWASHDLDQPHLPARTTAQVLATTVDYVHIPETRPTLTLV